MSTFALVHGAYHGRWCWNLLTPLLERAGHEVVALDLPVDDPAAGLDDYASLAESALSGVADDDVIVVGHSMGGLVAPLVAARRPVRSVVFLCSPIPEPGRSMNQQREADPTMMLGALAGHLTDVGGGLKACDAEGARKAFFHACPDLVADWGIRLLRPQSGTPTAQPVPLDALPDVPYTYVVCDDDRMISPDWSRRTARERLGIEAVELTGGHDPMLSSPIALADVLCAIADRPAAGR